MKPRVIVTRRWPAAVEQILEERFDTTFNQGDIPLSPTQLKSAFLNFDAILPTVSDKLPAAIFPDADIRTRLLANFGVGFSHIDIEAAKARGIAVTNTPGVLTDCTADIGMLKLRRMAAITVKVARMVGLPTSSTASTAAASGERSRMAMWR